MEKEEKEREGQTDREIRYIDRSVGRKIDW